jgi:lipopolysaccharide/colanic/teichoic acid biosynthesis glycosyltransferase
VIQVPNLAVLEPSLESAATSDPHSPLRDRIFPQQLFMRMLCLERKRSERSNRRFVLMLLESPALLGTDYSPALDKVLLSLSRLIRDTDITGWYQNGSILGVLFTEIGATDTSFADLLAPKVHHALLDVLGTQPLQEIKLSFHTFPDDCLGQGTGNQVFSILYPDLVHAIDSKRASLVVKRCMDIVGSLLAIFLLSPLLVLVALVIKLTSPGPVLFRQQRLGQFGEEFTFLKFRSMHAKTDHSIHEEYVKRFISNQAESQETGTTQKVYKIKNDPRVTKIGGFIRRTSLDELPQLFNVVTGKMSLVGPRPPLPYEVKAYELWHKGRLVAVKPGITGLWQVAGRSRVKFDDMIRMDLEYARTWSLWLDIKILLRTPHAVLTGSGAY